MIYITGDVHGHHDIHKFNSKNTKDLNLTKDDYIIVCGDFGLIWQDTPEERYWLNWLSEKPYTILFVDGNHENFDKLNTQEGKMWNGGKVHIIKDNILHLMRGQLFTIEGSKFFTMGGGTSIDKIHRVQGISWWPEEEPSKKEFDEALDTLERVSYNVDYVITHTTSTYMMSRLGCFKERSPLNSFFDMLERDLKFKHWYFGHFHMDEEIDSKHTVLYNNIIKLYDNKI